MAYQKNSTQRHYTLAEMFLRANEVKRLFPSSEVRCKCGKMEIILSLKPTDVSIDYKIRLVAQQGDKSVDIFVEEPRIDLYENGKKVPHLYSNGSLCLYYPEYQEWDYSDSWAETLIPWASLWLFYYEIWKDTGNWLGGGIHGSKTE